MSKFTVSLLGSPIVMEDQAGFVSVFPARVLDSRGGIVNPYWIFAYIFLLIFALFDSRSTDSASCSSTFVLVSL